MKRWLVYSLLALVVLLLIVIGGGIWIVSTESGLRFMTTQAQRWAPGQLKIEHLEGRLLDKLRIEQFSYQHDETTIAIDSFQLDWQASALFNAKVHVNQLYIDGIEAYLPQKSEQQEESTPLQIPDIQLPFSIALDEVQINHVLIQTAEAEPLVIDSIALRSNTTDVVSLQHLQIDSPLFQAKLVGEVGLTTPHPVQLDLDWSAQLPEFLVVGNGQLSGDTQELVLTHTVSNPLEVELETVVKDVLGQLNWDAQLQWQTLYWPLTATTVQDYLVHSQQGRVNLTGDLEDYQINFQAKVTGKQIPPGDWMLLARGNRQTLTIEKLHSNVLQGEVKAAGQVSWQPQLAGHINLDVGAINLQPLWQDWPKQLRLNSQLVAELEQDHFKINQWQVNLPETTTQMTLQGEGVLAGEQSHLQIATLSWHDLQWPLVSETATVISEQGQVNLTGDLQNYQIDLETQVAGAGIPAGQWSIQGQGNQRQLRIESLQSDVLQGIINATGKVSWQPVMTAQINLNAEQLKLKELWPEWPEQLSLNSQVTAQLDDKDFQINRLNLLIPQTTTQLALQGAGTLTADLPLIKNATLQWQDVQWPLVGKESVVTSSQGQLNLAGTWQDYQVDLATQLAGARIPSGQWTLVGQGNQQQFTVNSLRSNWLEGAVYATGKIGWQPTLVGQVSLDTKKINIKDFWPDWPAQLRLDSQLNATLDGDKFKVQQFEITLPQTATQLVFQSEGTIAGKNTQLEQAKLTWQQVQWPLVGEASQFSSKSGQLELTGSLPDYRVQLATHLSGVQVPAGQWLINGKGNEQQLTIESLRSQLLAGQLTGQGQVSWQPELAAQVELEAKQFNLKTLWAEWPDKLSLNSQLKADLAGDKFNIAQVTIHLPLTNTQLSLHGEGMLAGEKTSFISTLSWQNLHWPLLTEPATNFIVASQQGRFHAEGNLQKYQLQLDTDVKGKDIPQGHWLATGQGDNRHLQLKSVQGQVLQGALNLQGEVGWQPELYWQLLLKGDRLNPGKQWQQWPGQLALDVQSQGRINNGVLETQVAIKQIQGQLRDYPVQLQSDVMVTGQEYKVNQLEFKSGPSYLRADGQVGSQSQLKWVIDVPDLATLLPDGQGSITGSGSISGPLNLPHLVAHLEANSLVFQDKQLAALQTDVNVNLLSEQDLQLKVIATDFNQGKTQIEQFSLQGQGSMTDHTLVAKVQMPRDQVLLQLAGGLAASHWQGQLQQLTLSTQQMGNWQLQTPSRLSISATKAQLTQSCLQNQQTAKLCTQFKWDKQAASTVQVILNQLPLNLMRVILPENADLTGMIEGTVDASLDSNGEINSEVQINLSPGVFTNYSSEKAEKLAYQGGTFQLQLNPQHGLAAHLKLGLFKPNDLQGTISLPRLTRLPVVDKQPLQGEFKAHFTDLTQLPTLVPQAENIRGQVEMDVTLDGTLAAPQVQGQILVQEAAAHLPDLGLEIKDFNMKIHNQGTDTLHLQADLKSGEQGQLNLDGKMQSLFSPTWQADLKISGNQFEAVNIPMAWALISPELNIHLVPDRIDVTGEVRVPQAAITPPESKSSAVTASPDLVVINPREATQQEEPNLSKQLAIASQVKIILGDQVTFKGAGFKSRLAGTVVASSQPGKVPIGNGELNIIDGSYKAYGQNLTIDPGRITFTGGPIENPGLDIKAYRRIKNAGRNYRQLDIGDDDVIAGVYIQGTAQSPHLTLFSIPALDQSNTLSYIVLGKPAAQASGSEGDTLLKAATAMSLKEGDPLTQKIGQQVGLDEMGITSEGGVEEAALVVGKYLTPGLYISYGVGLFDGSTLLRMHYELTKRLTIETETGTQSGVDLRYTLEH